MRRKRYEDKYLDILDKSLSRASNVNRESVVREDVGASEGGGLYRAIGEGWRINLKKEAYGNPNSVYFAVLNLYPGRASNATAMRHREAWLTACRAHGGGGGGSTVGVFSTPRRRMRLS